MAIYRSTGLVDFVASKGSVRQALNNCRVLLFSGTQPTNADTGSSGASPLVTLTSEGGAYTAEVLPQWKVTIIGSSGSINSIKVGGVEQLTAAIPFNGTLTQTCSDAVNNINNNGAFPDYTATVSGVSNDEIIIYGPADCGATLNDLVLTVETTGLTYSLTNAGAVLTAGAAAVNGGRWVYVPTAGVISKTSHVWTGTVNTTGTASWFMIVTDNDTGTTYSTSFRRIIGSVGSTGADLNLSSTSLTVGASVSINSWTLTVSK